MRDGLMGSRSVVGGARVLDIGNIAGVLISHSIGHSLDAAVGEGNVVLTTGGVAITLLALAEVYAGVFILDTVLV